MRKFRSLIRESDGLFHGFEMTGAQLEEAVIKMVATDISECLSARFTEEQGGIQDCISSIMIFKSWPVEVNDGNYRSNIINLINDYLKLRCML